MLASGRTAPAAARRAKPPTQTFSLTGSELRRLRANQDGDRFCRWCPAFQIMVSERQQRICLRIIGPDRAYRDAVRFYPEAAHDSPLSILGERFDLDLVAFRDTPGLHVGFIHEHDHAAAEHAPIAVVETVNRCIVLVVASQCREPEHCRVRDWGVFVDPMKDQKIGAAGGGVPDPLAWRSGQVKAARLANPLIEISKQFREDLFNLVADPVVVCDIGIPVDAAIAQGGFRHAADDGDLRLQMLARRCNETG